MGNHLVKPTKNFCPANLLRFENEQAKFNSRAKFYLAIYFTFEPCKSSFRYHDSLLFSKPLKFFPHFLSRLFHENWLLFNFFFRICSVFMDSRERVCSITHQYIYRIADSLERILTSRTSFSSSYDPGMMLA